MSRMYDRNIPAAGRAACVLALLANVACTSYLPPPEGVSIADQAVRVTSVAGVTLSGPHPDGSGRIVECGGRFVTGRVGAIAGDTVRMSSISQRISDPGSPYACRYLRSGAVIARRGAELELGTRQFDGAKTLTLLAAVGVLAFLISTAEWELQTPPSPSCGPGSCVRTVTP